MENVLVSEVENLNGLPDEMKQKMSDLIKSLDRIEATIEKVNELNVQDVYSKIEPIEAAQYDWINIYSLNALYYVYLKTNGLLTKDHPLVTELTRIREYMRRIDTIKKNEQDKQKAHVVLDKNASARLIKRSLWQMASKQSTNATNTITEDEPKAKIFKK